MPCAPGRYGLDVMGEANIAVGAIMKFIMPTLLCALFLTACANPNNTDVEPLTEGAQLPTSGGLLVGPVGWQQCEESVFSRRTGIELGNIVTGEGYRVSVMTHDFRFVLPAERYMVQRIWGSGLSLFDPGL